MTDKKKLMSDQEARLLALNFEIVNEWAEVWLQVEDGKLTAEEALKKFNEFLIPIGQMLFMTLQLPGVSEQLADLRDEYDKQIAALDLN